ncbi:helix-turn-helix domain-containing protein [Shouchella clausii]|uniref:HTH cro/C1-type domain-containing protein n=1 Tax=Shouchella clausii TaxID=79880 RepID=A0A268NW50_SHOCL|nr:helix-turn-helix transcriptional regulator [Shouchella clausii]PAE87732.1 hypothetical protein CHH72_16515 [Shouchella clausii]PAF27330.1 hypothetical protein CHH61_04160 [Shouchella clausii]
MTLERITLYDMRMASGKSGAAIARLCGTTYRSLRYWETGTAIPNIVNTHDLLQIYGYSFYELDLTTFYAKQPNRGEKQKRIDEAAAQKKKFAIPPPRILSLYEMRRTSGYSGRTVARICGATYRSLRNWETGSSIPNVINIDDLLQIYGYSFHKLDLTPFYTTFGARRKKQKELDAQTDNPLRDRRLFEQGVEPSNKSRQ